jgi:transposase, IS30 family
MRRQEISLTQIAKGMGRHPSTQSGELKRNPGQRGYRYQQAHNTARQRHKDNSKAKKMVVALFNEVIMGLKKHGSSEQICGRLTHECQATASH